MLISINKDDLFSMLYDVQKEIIIDGNLAFIEVKEPSILAGNLVLGKKYIQEYYETTDNKPQLVAANCDIEVEPQIISLDLQESVSDILPVELPDNGKGYHAIIRVMTALETAEHENISVHTETYILWQEV